MLGLYETKLLPLSNYDGAQSIGRITENADLPFALRSKHVLMHRGNAKAFPDGFQGHLLWSQGEHSPDSNLQNIFVLPADHHFLRAGDVVRLNPEKCSLSTIYRKNAHNNTLIVTERCNNFCLMCSVVCVRSSPW